MVAVIFFDLDNFKIINDSLGHEAGDKMLIAIAERLRNCMRPGDTVARLGGDEFTFLLESLANTDEAVLVADRIVESLRAPIALPLNEIFASASIGIACSNFGQEHPAALLRDADTAMYQAKSRGKGCYVLFDQSMNDKVVQRMELETSLRRALEQTEFRVLYQPLINLNSGRMIGVEALVRWNHPTRGLVPPALFIPIAEETGLIIPIGFAVLHEACRQAKAWYDTYGEEEPLFMSVNLSGRQLQTMDVVERVARALRETGLLPYLLKLEITESFLMNDKVDAIEKMRGLKSLGVQLAIDDFGTGYSSMSSISDFPVDTIKIDQAFVGRLGDGRQSEAVVTAIIALSSAMQMDVIGEGVETEEQVVQLRRLGCHIGQGYYFAKPLTAHEIDRHLAANCIEFFKACSSAGNLSLADMVANTPMPLQKAA